MEDGTIGHAELELGGQVVMLATPNREYQSPKTHRESCEAAARWLDNPWVDRRAPRPGRRPRIAHHAPTRSKAGANVIRALAEEELRTVVVYTRRGPRGPSLDVPSRRLEYSSRRATS